VKPEGLVKQGTNRTCGFNTFCLRSQEKSALKKLLEVSPDATIYAMCNAWPSKALVNHRSRVLSLLP